MAIDFIALHTVGVRVFSYCIFALPGNYEAVCTVLRRKSIFHMVQHAFAVPTRTGCSRCDRFKSGSIGRLSAVCAALAAENGSLQTR